MSNFPEVGYTPANLRFLIESNGWTQAQTAALLGVADNTLRQWLIPVDLKSHRDMPHKMWVKLLEL